VLRRLFECSQYISLAFGNRCRDAGVRPSMGSVGDAYDNAMCESFFATLKCELLARHRFSTQAEARSAVFDFIEGFYNRRRATPRSAISHRWTLSDGVRRQRLIPTHISLKLPRFRGHRMVCV